MHSRSLASSAPAKDGINSAIQRQCRGPGPAQSLTPETKKSFNIAENVVAGAVITKVDPDSDAADKGLQPGDVVMRVGSRIVRTPTDFQTGVAEAKEGRQFQLRCCSWRARPGRHRFCRHRHRQDGDLPSAGLKTRA